jgi:predicted HTH transcriptional regulator
MFRTPLQDVDFQQVETFCHEWPEGVRVEYRQEITQIPKIVSSFANTMGGIWLIGVKTDRKTNMGSNRTKVRKVSSEAENGRTLSSCPLLKHAEGERRGNV